MKMLSTDLLMRSIWWLHMSGGKDLYTVYFLFLHILVPGPGSNGAEEKRSIVFKSMLNLNTTIHVFVLAGPGLSIKAWRSVIMMQKCYMSLSKIKQPMSFHTRTSSNFPCPLQNQNYWFALLTWYGLLCLMSISSTSAGACCRKFMPCDRVQIDI